MKSSGRRPRRTAVPVQAKDRRFLRQTGASCAASFALGTGKLLMGLGTGSPFPCLSAFYTYGMVAAKACALRGLRSAPERQAGYCRRTAQILIAASVLYALSSTQPLFDPQAAHYHPYAAMGIAAVTFAEIGLGLRGVLAAGRRGAPLFRAIRMVNLASALICLTLTQTALLSIPHGEGADYDPSAANGWMGVLMGACAALLGCRMLLQTKSTQREGTP